jgi:4-carboxymuconolactone decarboxylase
VPRLSRPRIAPLATEDFDAETNELLSGNAFGEPINIFRTMANHPKLMKRWLVFANHVLFKSSLGERERELAILRAGWLCRSEYEWAQHVVIARRSGISDAEIGRITLGPQAGGWTDLERAILTATDELHADAFVGDATWAALAAHLDTEQLMDLVFTVGQYHLVSMALNSFGVQLDEGLEGFPE